MATAKKSSTFETQMVDVSKTIIVKEKRQVLIPGVELKLTREEATTLLDITYRIGGDPTHSRRKYVEPIKKALEDVCLGTSPYAVSDIEPDNQAIYFKNTL